MNIIIDATWIGALYNSNVINGGYRVLDNLLKQLHRYPEHTFYLTHTTHRLSYTRNIVEYLENISAPQNIQIACLSYKLFDSNNILKIYKIINGKLPIHSFIPFIAQSIISKSDIFYSALDASPFTIRKNKKIKKYFTALDLIPICKPEYSNLFYAYTKNLYDKLDDQSRVFAISQSTKNDIITYRPDLNPGKIKVTHLAADPKIFYEVVDITILDSILSKYALKNRNYFLTLNNIAPYKNTELIIKSFLEWKKDQEIKDITLVLIGRKLDEKYSNYLNELCGDSKQIIFLENIPDADLATLYSRAIGFLYMSLYEGFGLPVLEAMQCGTPVICSNTSSMPEVAGEAAISLDPTDKNSLITAMTMLLDPEINEAHRVKSLIQAQKFTWEKYSEQIILGFEQM